MAGNTTYFTSNHGGWGSFSPCEGCYPDSDLCSTSTLEDLSIIINGFDPDGAHNWEDEDITQVSDRVDLTDRWPYQIITATPINLSNYNCDSSCAYLIRIQYALPVKCNLAKKY